MTLQPTLDDGEPFQPDSVTPGSGRVPRPVLVGCGCLLGIIAVGLVVLVLRGEEVARWGLRWSLETVQREVEAALPEEIGEAERSRLDAAFRAARERIEGEELDPASMQALQRVLPDISRALGEQERLRPEQVRELIEALESFAGTKSETGDGSNRGAPRSGTP